MVPLLPRVTIFSATERAALALASVVVTRLCMMRLHTMFLSIALRCSPVRPNLAVRLRCRINVLLTGARQGVGIFFRGLEQIGLESHAQSKSKRLKFVFDFVQR